MSSIYTNLQNAVLVRINMNIMYVYKSVEVYF